MNKKRLVSVRSENCLDCGFCRQYVACSLKKTGCIGCGVCIKGCPQGAIDLQPRTAPGSVIQFKVDGNDYQVEGPLSVLHALDELEFPVKSAVSGDDSNQAFCVTGGCWNCAVVIDGALSPSCMTPLREGMEIDLKPDIIQRTEPLRIVTLMRPAPHYHPSIFTHGCNFSCDLCHNWNLTFSSVGRTISPKKTVAGLNLDLEEDYWVGISGGEPTLNRRWLVETVRELRLAAPDIRIQLDTNASLLTPDYIDELVEAGITDISPDLKAKGLDTFMKVCGITSEKTARFYLETSWEAVRYLNDAYGDQIFMAVSVPCHPNSHSIKELKGIAKTIVSINPEIPVTLIEYQPAFRLRDWPFVSGKAMDQVLKVFESIGLSRVIVQGGAEIPRAMDPLDLPLSSEEF